MSVNVGAAAPILRLIRWQDQRENNVPVCSVSTSPVHSPWEIMVRIADAPPTLHTTLLRCLLRQGTLAMELPQGERPPFFSGVEIFQGTIASQITAYC